MTIKEIINCQKKFENIKDQINNFTAAYMDVIYRKILELDKDFNSTTTIKKCDDGSMVFPFYEYEIKISRPNYFGIPNEVYKSAGSYSIKDIVDSKYDSFSGCIDFSYAIKGREDSVYTNLLNMYVNFDGVYKIDQIISGGKNTFKDECKAILLECVSRIYTNNYICL
jgi:hypothetical protein